MDKVIEIERGTSQVFNGNYSAYAEKKKAQRDAQMKLYMNQQQEIHHQEEVITKLRSFNREKSIKRAESREKMLSKTWTRGQTRCLKQQDAYYFRTRSPQR